ncbi:hypothetical protein M406DRAFT_329802 [Cryphonectria parasitica EP155]|uniref:Uncharacterized protein n=1 Tax=Cryphonectria parasitica (strain ATCC 38755 / EP155) TaxID=660469 RepID=A0A9P4Y410_CRYP1|nr:uncharacterized protein M406DRAFT_329802 [Cryphonectria parasitica EP155]KAF3765957.1 hypothetical protein M406DRAFT_329802 [Cryphonectria parasitica EP155]
MNRQPTSQSSRRSAPRRNSSGFYRPGRRDRDQNADQRHSTNPDHDHDRDHDPPNQHQNTSVSEQNRPRQDSPQKQWREQAQSSADFQGNETDQDKAELATLHRQLCNTIADNVRWTNKKETEARGFQRREENFKKPGSSHFPALAESLRREQIQFRRQQDVFDEEIAKTEALLDKVSDNFCQRLAKAQLIDKSKARQYIEIAKEELANAEKSTIAPEAADRIQKLEEQFASVQETQDAQKHCLDELRQENERLRAREALYESQAGELATLKTQCAQLQRQFDSQAEAQLSALDALNRTKESFADEVSQLRDQFATFVQRVATQHTEATDSFQQYACSQDSKAAKHAASWEERMTKVERRVDEHGKQIASFDMKAHHEALQKSLAYPPWTALDDRLRQLSAVDEQGRRGVEEQFGKLTDMVIETMRNFISKASTEASDLKKRVQAVETQAAAPPRAPLVVGAASSHPNSPAAEPGAITQRIEATETAVSSLESASTTLRNDLEVLRKAYDTRLKANEQMILNLDGQWQNMSTVDMAHLIMQHFNKLSATINPAEMKRLCDRLANLETWRTDITQHREKVKNWARETEAKRETFGKRGSVNNDPLERTRKRQRVEDVSGAATGLAAQQASPA